MNGARERAQTLPVTLQPVCGDPENTRRRPLHDSPAPRPFHAHRHLPTAPKAPVLGRFHRLSTEQCSLLATAAAEGGSAASSASREMHPAGGRRLPQRRAAILSRSGPSLAPRVTRRSPSVSATSPSLRPHPRPYACVLRTCGHSGQAHSSLAGVAAAGGVRCLYLHGVTTLRSRVRGCEPAPPPLSHPGSRGPRRRPDDAAASAHSQLCEREREWVAPSRRDPGTAVLAREAAPHAAPALLGRRRNGGGTRSLGAAARRLVVPTVRAVRDGERAVVRDARRAGGARRRLEVHAAAHRERAARGADRAVRLSRASLGGLGGSEASSSTREGGADVGCAARRAQQQHGSRVRLDVRRKVPREPHRQFSGARANNSWRRGQELPRGII